MKITINGQKKELPTPIPLSSLIGQFCPNPKRIITEVNGQIIKIPAWDETSIKDGDVIELISFVGGG